MRWILKGRKRKPDAFSVYIMSDLHLDNNASDDKNFPNLSDPPMYFYTSRMKLEKFVEQVHIEKPNVVLHLGDVIHGHAPNESFDTFMSYWNQITVRKMISPGNHDTSHERSLNELGLSIHDFIAKKLGYESNDLIAGSKFNESIVVADKGVSVRFINFDTNIKPDGGYSSTAPARVADDLIAWIENEILIAEEKNIVLMTHKADKYIDSPDRVKLYNMLWGVLKTKTNTRVTLLYGHSHIETIEEKPNNVDRLRIYNIPAVVDLNPGKFYKMYFSKDGDVSFRLGNLAWN